VSQCRAGRVSCSNAGRSDCTRCVMGRELVQGDASGASDECRVWVLTDAMRAATVEVVFGGALSDIIARDEAIESTVISAVVGRCNTAGVVCGNTVPLTGNGDVSVAFVSVTSVSPTETRVGIVARVLRRRVREEDTAVVPGVVLSSALNVSVSQLQVSSSASVTVVWNNDAGDSGGGGAGAGTGASSSDSGGGMGIIAGAAAGGVLLLLVVVVAVVVMQRRRRRKEKMQGVVDRSGSDLELVGHGDRRGSMGRDARARFMDSLQGLDGREHSGESGDDAQLSGLDSLRRKRFLRPSLDQSSRGSISRERENAADSEESRYDRLAGFSTMNPVYLGSNASHTGSVSDTTESVQGGSASAYDLLEVRTPFQQMLYSNADA
jgi:hypothetical protein